MSDAELDRLLRAARPATSADVGWATSAEGTDALIAVRARLADASSKPGRRVPRQLPRLFRPAGYAPALLTAAAVVVAVALTLSNEPGRPAAAPVGGGPVPPLVTGPAAIGPTPPAMTLAAYTNCDALLAGLRAHTAQNVNDYGLNNLANYGPYGAYNGMALQSGIRADVAIPSLGAPTAAAQPATGYSTTNDQEADVDEPDIVKTDGTRIVSVSGGVLRILDAATHTITGTLDLGMYAGADGAQLFMAGNRVLVLLGSPTSDWDFTPYMPSPATSTVLLVDIAHAPTVVATLHTNAAYLDARLADGTVRLVVDSAPQLTFPQPRGSQTGKERVAANRTIVEHAPIGAWLPTYGTTVGGVTTSHAVPCTQVRHPVHFTGESMLTIYSIDLGGDLTNVDPVSLAADGGTVYATASSLYVAAADENSTELHRFDISGPGAPTYLGSGSVPGRLLDSYSMSEYGGTLRVVTTAGGSRTVDTSLYVLDAATLRRDGSVGGLGKGEQVHAVRFLDELAYVVTYESVDPLYVLDLADPHHPKLTGALQVTGYSDYLHPTSDGRLLGVGETVDKHREVNGLQVSLFDVANPAKPSRLARVVRSNTPSENPLDPHAFLFWPATGTAVVPIDSWNEQQSGAALVLRVQQNSLSTTGLIRNPAVSNKNGADAGIERTLVIGSALWTLSGAGLQASDLSTLHRLAWVPFT